VRGVVGTTASIGIDVGGTKTVFLLLDADFEVITELKERTPKRKKDFTAFMINSVKSLTKTATKKAMEVSAVGVGCAGSIDSEKGIVTIAPNLPELNGLSFVRILGKATVAPVLLHNDVHAALYGELRLGAAVGAKHVVGVFIGTGIGGAIVIDGKLYLGASGNAGDIGNYLLQPYGPLAGSPRQGVLDDVASRTAIAADAAALAIKQWAPSLLQKTGTDLRNIRSGDLAKAISAGDRAIEQLVRGRARVIGIVLSNIIDFINPEMVLLGGGLTEALPDIMREEVTHGIEEHTSSNARRVLRVVTTKLEGHAVAIGAAKLAVEAASTTRPREKQGTGERQSGSKRHRK